MTELVVDGVGGEGVFLGEQPLVEKDDYLLV